MEQYLQIDGFLPTGYQALDTTNEPTIPLHSSAYSSVTVQQVTFSPEFVANSKKMTAAQKSIKNLVNIRELMKKGWKKDDFSALWNSQNPSDHEIARTYEHFYGTDAIRLEKHPDGHPGSRLYQPDMVHSQLS